MSKHILFISSWYPTPEKKSHGIFFKRQAEAAALNNTISAIYVSSGDNDRQSVLMENKVYTVLGTYQKVTHNIPVLSSVLKLWRSLRCFKSCYKLLAASKPKPQLVLLNVIFPAGIFVLWLHYFKKIPFIIQEQWSGYYPEDGNYKGFITKKITERCVNKAKAVLVVSDKLEQHMKLHGLHNNYIKIGNVVDTDLFTPTVGRDMQPFKFIHVSTVNDKEKNISGMIEAAHILALKQISFRIDIVGDGPERESFETLAHRYGLLNRVIFFHGFQPPESVAQFMAKGHCFILNSNYEGLPCVLLEAMACGIPVITTNVGAVPEIFDFKLGMMILPKHNKELAQAMEDIMAGYAQYNGKEIRASILKKYSYPAIANDFDAIFKSVLIHE